MQLLSHIDIIEPQRIRALLADPRNFTWPAIDSETLDTWTPDLGLSAYPRPSIFRAGAVARSGLPSRLRHRFWQTIEKQADHTGQRYIGILMYLAAGESAPLELRLAGVDIGRIEPRHYDNRLHLLVVDRPVEFIGEMEIFELTAPGKGSYRIESFVLLAERPAPSRFLPAIENLSLRLEERADGKWAAHLHFLTSRAAPVQARVSDSADGSLKAQATGAGRLHHLVLPDLPAEKTYVATISVGDAVGAAASERLQFSTTQLESPATGEVSVPLEILNPGSSDLTGLPLTFGAPLARGAAYKIASCCLKADGETLPVTARALSRWADGSLRWALIETTVPAALGRSALAATLCINGKSAPPAKTGPPALRLLEQDGDIKIESADQTMLSVADFAFAAVLGNGLALTASAPRRIQQATAGAFTFEIDHEDASGGVHLRSKIRLRAYPGQRFLRLHHRLEVISPALAPAAAGGPQPSDCPEFLRGAIAGIEGERSALLKLRCFSIGIPIAAPRRVQQAGESWPLNGSRWQLRQDHDLAYAVGLEQRPGRAQGQVRVEGATGALGIGLRHFWQKYPKALSVTADAVWLELFPERAGRALPGDADAAHRLYFWLDEAGYLLKAGLALSNEILLDFSGGQPALFDWLERGAVARPAIDYLNATGALNPLGPRHASSLPAYEALADRALRSFHEDQEHFRAYSQINFGDWYGESGWSWGNNEYDPAYCGYSEFLRGGDAGWALWAADAARHLADVDTINFSSDTAEIGGQSMHMPGHLGGYLPPYFRSKMGGTKSIPSHTWVEGLLLHYLLTGDEAVYESLLKTRRWLLQGKFFDYYDFSNAREAGWHLIHLCMLAAVLDDRDCLNAARIIVARVLERQAPGGGWQRLLTESHCGCGYPRCQGEAGFMVGVLLSGLQRYYRLVADPAVAEAIGGGARWLIRHTFDQASGQFRYTSCPNRTLGGNFQCTQWVLEGLAAAWELTSDAEIGQYLRAGLAVIGQFPSGIGHLGLGKAMAQQMRYVPTILAALKKRPLEE